MNTLCKTTRSLPRKSFPASMTKFSFCVIFPELGHNYSEEPEGNIRVLLYGHYRIAYMITDDYIDILGIFHGALDIERYLH
jgi:plasmid stabilization system protein ParE